MKLSVENGVYVRHNGVPCSCAVEVSVGVNEALAYALVAVPAGIFGVHRHAAEQRLDLGACAAAPRHCVL